jgi:formate dehydrogenase alpha subunit
MVRVNGNLRETTWKEALDQVSKKLTALKENSGGESIGAIAPSRGTNEEVYLLQKLMRLVLGSNNVDSPARLGSGPTLLGLSEAFGYGAMTNCLDGVVGADVILVVGADPDEDNLIFAHKIRRAVLKNDARVILVDPRRTSLEKYANVWLRPVLGSDVAWINGVIRTIIDENLVDNGFVRERTQGFDQLKKSVSQYTPESVEKLTGIPAEELRKAARLFGNARNAVIAYGSGITQQSRGTEGVRALANLALLTGNVGKEQGGVYPLCSQSNCQGSFDMGGLPEFLPGYQRVDNRTIRQKFEQAWGGELPAKQGLSLGEMPNAMENGKIKGLIVVGENPLISLPTPKGFEEALNKLEMLVVVDTFFTETAEKADVVLPGATFAEKDGTFTSMERRVQRVRQAIPPLGEKAEWEIITALASQMGRSMDYKHPSEIFSEIASLTPLLSGMDYQTLEEGGLQWPCPESHHPGTPVLYREGFLDGKGRFSIVEYREPDEKPNEDYPLWLSVGGTLYNYEIGTKEKRALGLAAWYPETALEIHPEDAEALEISDGDRIRLTSPRDQIETKARISDRLAKGMVYLAPPFYDVEVNAVLHPDFDAPAGAPVYKACPVKVERA